MIFRFIEILIDDVVAANQYYNKKFESIKQEYEKLNTLVQADFKKVDSKKWCVISQRRGLFHSRKWDPMLSSKISELLGEMLLLQYFSSTNYTGIRKVCMVGDCDLF